MEGWKHFVWFHFCLSTCCEALQCNSTFHFTSFTIFSRRSVHFTHVSTRPCLFCLDLSVWTLVDCLCAGLFFHCVSFFPCMFFSLFFSPCLCGFSHLLSLMRKGAASMPTLPSRDFCLVKGGPILKLCLLLSYFYFTFWFSLEIGTLSIFCLRLILAIQNHLHCKVLYTSPHPEIPIPIHSTKSIWEGVDSHERDFTCAQSQSLMLCLCMCSKHV